MTQAQAARSAAAPERDKPWLIRTYSGHSTAAKSNELYRKNLSKGQTGLSIAFDLPTQTGYDADHELARGEVGKVGVPVSHLGDMRTLLAGIPLEQMNTSMTINATAAWLLALYVATADGQGADRTKLTGTIQNDIIKEYLSRGTYVFPPEPSLRLIKDTILFTCSAMPKWNPTNVCSYHLQEAGATPVQELAFALATAQAVLDAVKLPARSRPPTSAPSSGASRSSSTRACRFITEICKMRAFTELWDEITATRYGVDGSQAQAVPLWRAGQLAGADRAAARKQRLSHPDRDAGGHALERCARPRRAAAGLERGARSAAAVGPAMVHPHAADPGLRDGPARLSGHVRRLDRHSPQGRRVEGRGKGRACAHRRHGRGRRGHRHDEARAGREQHRAAAQDREPASRSSWASIDGPRRKTRRSPPAKAPSRPSIPQ